MQKSGRATLEDVARFAGVSIKTASRVVRREPNVREKTRERVEESIKALNYRPTISARSTGGHRSFMIGLLFDNPNPSYIYDLLSASLQRARVGGYHIVVEPVNLAAKNSDEIVKHLVIQSNLAGVILPPPLCDNTRILKALQALGKPVARIAPGKMRKIGSIVETDDVGAATKMTEHLIEIGHTDIAFISGRKGTSTTKKRLKGFTGALKNAGLPVKPENILSGDYQYRSGMEAGEELLTRTNPPTAIFAGNDDMAAGVIAAAHKLGISVPGEISIVGFDDSTIAEVVWPRLTTVKQPIHQMASLAVEMLISNIRNDIEEKAEPMMIPCELILRESSAPPANKRR